MTIKGLKTIIIQGDNMNTRIILTKNAKQLLRTSSLLAVSALLITACSQQPTSIPEAGGGSNGAGNAGAGSTAGNGSNTQGANVGSGGDPRSTGSGGGYPAGGNPNGQGGSGKNNAAITIANLNNPDSLLSKRIIYFDYNLASIKPQYQAILDAHTKLLAAHPNVNVRLEGHADERGTREFNVALSEERAKSVQWSMRGKGVKGSQTELIAYGEERPAIVGDGEKSWSKNRRVEIKYPGR